MMLYRKIWYNMESKLQTSMYTVVLFLVKKEVYTKTWWLYPYDCEQKFHWRMDCWTSLLCPLLIFPLWIIFNKKYKLYNQRIVSKHVCL